MVNKHVINLTKVHVLLIFISIIFYSLFSYNLVRTDYIKLVFFYTILFISFYGLLRKNILNDKILTTIAFLFRVIFIFSIPNLSQDFYRFIWDGRMILEGFNPYLYTPDSFILQNLFPIEQAQSLANGMGALSRSHFTNYPPINQLCFVIAGLFAGKSILGSTIILRLIIISADFGTLYYGKKLLEKFNLPSVNIFWYILNPFIIIELTGNLHFEGVMIFFLVWSIYLLKTNKWKWSAVIFSLSVSIKLIPLILLPLLFRNLGFKKSILYYSIVGLITLTLFTPFISNEFINNYIETVALWFQNFEFNASFYYLAREIGYSFRGYNEIGIIGKYIPIVVLTFVIASSLKKKNKNLLYSMHTMLFVLSFYYFVATTVHPWYIATLLILSVFTKYKFVLIWTFTITLSYLAYANSRNTENLWIIGFEYIIMYTFLIWELLIYFNKRRLTKSTLKE